ncbi:hypothetical protein FG877_03500 [Enterococcus casseliflavus]|nr:hypothetical protein CO692_09835 [Enterococcus sp. FDAARGOS_375]AYJ43934.1 hypothetical protein D8N35_02015 [Enterococcus casseliflavus]EAC3867995.1 hypothetical protein [Listeria monocytogenes]TPR58809.1 hypothetical protein FJU10_02840 [Enterococcus sp. OL5]HAB95933.1 hypothetical protein [Enterococcus sp.]
MKQHVYSRAREHRRNKIGFACIDFVGPQMNNLRTVLACLSCAMFCERFVDDDLSTAVFQSWSTAVFLLFHPYLLVQLVKGKRKNEKK